MSAERTSTQPAVWLVGEELTAAPPALQLADDLADVRVDERLDLLLSSFGLVVERDQATFPDRHVALLHRRQPVGLVLLGVVLAADPEEAPVEQPDGTGEHTLARHPGQFDVSRGDRSQRAEAPWRRRSSRRTSPGLAAGATRRGSGIAFGRRRQCRWPGCGRSGGDRSRRRSTPEGSRVRAIRSEHLRVLDPPAGLVEVLEAAAAPAPGDSRAGAVGSSQSRHGSGVFPAAARLNPAHRRGVRWPSGRAPGGCRAW